MAITNNAKFRDAYEPVSLAIQKYRKGDKKNVAGVTFSLQKQGETDKTDVTTDDSGKASSHLNRMIHGKTKRHIR